MKHRGKPVCQVDDLNIQDGSVSVRFLALHNTVKFSLSELAQDHHVIDGLPKKQSAWLGYNCGKHSKSCCTDLSQINSAMGDAYHLYSIDRTGYLYYIDVETKKTIKHYPKTVLTTNALINRFSNRQIFYIGYLHGISTSRE